MNRRLHILREQGPPLRARSTSLVAAALASGFKFASSSPLLDCVEQVDGQPVRTTTWSMSDGEEMPFTPAGVKPEQLTFTEFRNRYESLEWCKANPNNPIAYMRAMAEQLEAIRTEVRKLKPMIKMRKGRKIALIPQDASDEVVAELLKDY